MDDVKHAGDPNCKLVTFSWDLVDVCNYRCSYCSAEHFLKKQIDTTKLQSYKQVVKQLSLNRIPKFNVELLGGEPTLHPDLLEIVKGLNSIKNCLKIELVTNFSRSLDYYQQFDVPECSKLQITPSYHPEYFKTSFVDKCVVIRDAKHITICPNINLSDNEDYWAGTLELINTLKTQKVLFGLNFLIPTKAGWSPVYTEKFFETFKLVITENPKSITRGIPYNINGKITSLNEYDIQKHGLRFFKGFRCTPLMWYIKTDGRIVNHCTHTPLVPLGNNIDEQVICDIGTGCCCDIKYSYFKTRVGDA